MDTAHLLYILIAILLVGLATAILLAWLTARRKHHRHRKISTAKRRDDTKHNLIEAEAPARSDRPRSKRHARRRDSRVRIDLFNQPKQDDIKTSDPE